VLGISSIAMAWTLVLEFLFYLIAPFLVRWKRYFRFAVIGSIFLVAYLFFHYHWLSYYLTSYAFIEDLDYFMLGYFSYIVYTSLPFHKLPKGFLAAITLLSLLFVLIYSLWPISHLQYKWMEFNDWIYYLGVTASVPFLFEFSKHFVWDTVIADLSYPIYISHLLIVQFVTYTHLAKPHTQTFIVSGLILTVIFSWTMVKLLEKPIDKYRQKRVKLAAENR
jgi:peptidoglycan/LPS O-acetylase OafA/YrhL